MAGEIKAPAPWEADPARVKRIAVAQDGRMHVFDHVPPLRFAEGEHLAYTADTMLRGMVLFALHEECAALWLMSPHAGDIGQQMRELLDDPPAGREVTELSSDGHLAGLRISRVNADGHHIGAPFMVYLTDQADHWGIAGQIADLAPAQLAEGLMLAAHLLDMQLRFSPSYVGLQVMRQVLARSKADITPLAPWAEELVQAHRPTYVQWSREIPTDLLADGDSPGSPHGTSPALARFQSSPPRGAVCVYKYDRNSSFLASAGEVGVGDPMATEVYQPGCPGFYRVTTDSWDDARELPGPIHTGEGAGEYPPAIVNEWAWEPQIRLALKHGYTVRIHEGYYWPREQKHDLLRPWRERMWRGREAAVAYDGPAGRVAKALIKKSSVAAIGRLSPRKARAVMQTPAARAEGRRILHRELDERGMWTGMAAVVAEYGKTDLIQRAWWATDISNANERLFTSLYDHAAYHPILAYVDAGYYLSPWPESDPTLSPQLGKWKLEHSFWMDRDQIEAYNALDSAQSRVKLLARIARGQGIEPEEPEEAEDDYGD